jgi:parvulin-like peptidyl-prolyl isomerase
VGAKSGRNKGGAKPKAGGATTKRGGRNSGRTAQRVGLVVFGVLFIALFVVFAVAEGLGAPSIPSGDIALVSSVPADLGHISEADYKHLYAQQVAQAGVKKAPKAGSKKAEELHKTTVAELLNTAWITGESEELGIKITNKEIETELAKIKKESFKTEKAFQEFLKEDHYTEEDVNQRIELQLLSTKIQEKITKEAPPVTEAELKAYYEAEKASQYTKKPTRDVRVVVNENKKEVEAAQKALEADNSEASWKKVTKKYSPTTATNGGLQKEIAEEFLTEPLKKDIFKSATGEIVGPVKQEKNYLLLEVVKLHPEKVQPFPEVKATIETTLATQKQEKYFSTWVTGFQSKWSSRSQCASGFVIEQCANYKGSGHPATASAACYEANPKTPATECPAPVTQNTPAVPGTVTLAKPEGERLVQRPRPEAKSKKEEEEAAAAAGAGGAAGAAGAAGAEGAEGAEGASPEVTPEEEAEIKQAEEEAAAGEEPGSSGGGEAKK